MPLWHIVPYTETMQPSAPSASPPGAAPARPLAERRREATRLEIARAAAGLFAKHGPQHVTAEAISEAAGISLRTFYRYFAAKEDAITPLLTSGADNWVGLLSDAPERDPLALFPRLIDEVLLPQTSAAREELRVTRGVLRGIAETPLLSAAWHRVNADSEARLRPILSKLCGPDADPLDVRILATIASDAIRLGLEHWAAGETDPDGSEGVPAAIAQQVFARLSRGLSQDFSE